MTNLTDEGLMNRAGKIAFHYEDLPCNVENLTKDIFRFVQQIRDAAKKETWHKDSEVIHALRNLILCLQTQTPHSEELELASKLVQEWDATAIRQMDGGK